MSLFPKVKPQISWNVISETGTCAACKAEGQVHSMQSKTATLVIEAGMSIKTLKRNEPLGTFCWKCVVEKMSPYKQGNVG